jgi:hypothetical protein
MDSFLKQIESGTADIPFFVKENYQTTFDNSQSVGSQLFDIFLPDNSLILKTNPNKIHTTLVYLDGELSILRQDSPPNLRPFPENAGILRSR